MPIRGRRWLVEIPEITRTFDVEGTPTELPIIVKMKRGLAEFFDLTQLESDAARLRGTFGGTGSNAGKTFQRRLGGFRQDSYKFLAKSEFSITEYYFDSSNNPVNNTGTFKTFSVGFPAGVTVNELIDWLKTKTTQAEEIDFIVSPAGVQTPIYFESGT